MDINAYLERIQYHGERTPNLQTLTELHRAHLLKISYENLNIHLGRALTLDEQDIFDKLVTQRRGGWCFEMNGLFAWALRELGFKVTLLASAVNGAKRTHLILLVDLGRPYLVDVGFGNGFLEPIPLTPGEYAQDYLNYALNDDGTLWHFTNHIYGGAGYDFNLEPQTLASFAEPCQMLQTSPESGFVRVTVCHRFTPTGIISLRGAVLRTITAAGAEDRTITDEADYRRVLEEQFDLCLSDAETATLWKIAWQKHQEFLQQQRS